MSATPIYDQLQRERIAAPFVQARHDLQTQHLGADVKDGFGPGSAGRAMVLILSAVLMALIIVIGGVIGAARAEATPPADSTVEVFWSMPDGGTPENVTWPQTYSPAGAGECGLWYQVDTYKAGDVERLIADGILTHGEDHGIAISWRFVYGGDCPPPFAPERFEEQRTSGPLEPTCETASVTWETWTVERHSTEDGGFTEWTEVPDSRTSHEDALTAEDELACNPPGEPPTTPEQPADPPTVPEEPTTPVEPPTTPEQPTPPAVPTPEPPDMTTQRIATPDVPVLAETGTSDDHAALVVGALTLIMLGAGLVAVRRIRGRR